MTRAVIVGTSHVSHESIERVKAEIEKFKPDVLCIELDEKRYEALKSGRRPKFKEAVKKGGLFLYIFSVMQQYLGKKAGGVPGMDMLVSAKLAIENDIPVALVDMDVEEITKNIRSVPRKDKLKLVGSLLTGVLIPQKGLDIKKIPSDKLIEQALKQVKKISPRFYKELVTKRNKYMADEIQAVIKDKKAKRVLVVVGAGHKREIARILERRKIKTRIV